MARYSRSHPSAGNSPRPTGNLALHDRHPHLPEPPASDLLAGLDILGDDLRKLAEGVVVAYKNCLSPDTRRTYAEGWHSFVTFAATRVPPLPVQPEHPEDTRYLLTIALWLVWSLTAAPVYRGPSSDREIIRVGLSWRTAKTRLSGIVSQYRELGIPDPTRHPALANVIDGLARRHGAKPQKVTPLATAELRRVIDATYQMSPQTLRDRALVVSAHSRVHPRGLERMRWEDLTVDDTTWTFGTGPTAIILRGRPEMIELCPLTALAAWRSDGLGGPFAGPVFPALTGPGRPRRDRTGVTVTATHQSLTKTIRWRAAHAGLVLPPGVSVPDLSNPDDVRRVLDSMDNAALGDVRDRSIISLGFVVASRRRNLAEFDVADIDILDAGALVTFRRSKTDQYGHNPRVADISRVDAGRYDPVANLEVWLRRYAKALGRPLTPADPLYCRIDRHGCILANPADTRRTYLTGPSIVPARLARPAFSDIIRKRAAAAGLTGRYRSHSMRRGMALSAARQGVPIQTIAKRGGWESLDTVAGYIDEAERFMDNFAEKLGLAERRP